MSIVQLNMTIFIILLSVFLLAASVFFMNRKQSKKLKNDIDRQNELLKTVNQISTILLEPNKEKIENRFMFALHITAKTVDADNVTIWKNQFLNDNLFCSLIYEWSGSGTPDRNNPATQNILYKDTRWENILSNGNCINAVVRDLPYNEQFALNEKGVVSIFVAPVFTDDVFWGFVGFEDCRNERIFTENESMILRSAGRMIGNAYIRNETTMRLEKAVAKANEANKFIKTSMHSLESILNSIDAMIYATIPGTGEILFVNNRMKKFFGRENENLVGQYCFKLFRDSDKICEFCPCFHLNKNPERIYVWNEYIESSKIHIRHSDCYIDWPSGEKVHLQHAVDVTDLKNAREQAEQSSRSKSIFLSHMSHEIRTPMNAILGIAEIQLQKETLSEDTGEAFGKIYESGDLLLNIINDILDLSKIESGKLELVPVTYDIPSLINDTTQINRLRYESKPIDFLIHLDKNTPLKLIGDEIRIKQILNNILSNAFKYTDEGKIEFSIFCEDAQEPENVTLVFRVKDTGQCMTDEQLIRIFEEYTRFNLEMNRTTVGAGLGISITKRLVDLMEGRIIVESGMGKGSVFTVRLPQKRAGVGVCGETLIKKLRDFSFHSAARIKKMQFLREYMPYGSVLVVDDVESNIYVAKGMMIPYGLKIETAFSGQEAIDKIKSGNVYDIIFMDHMMPKMDGIEAVRLIRETGYKHPIIALTANALLGRAKMFLQNGFDSFLSKPIDSRELNHLLNSFIKNRKPHDVVEAARRVPAAERVINGGQSNDEKIARLHNFFIRDAQNAVNILENIRLDDFEIESYITTVHGMKSALANIGENELSAFAKKLEYAGRDRNFEILINETPSFINALNYSILKYKPCDKDTREEIPPEDISYLREKLYGIKTDCLDLEKTKAKMTLNELKSKSWSGDIHDVLEKISVHLLHSEFREIVELVDEEFLFKT